MILDDPNLIYCKCDIHRTKVLSSSNVTKVKIIQETCPEIRCKKKNKNPKKEEDEEQEERKTKTVENVSFFPVY